MIKEIIGFCILISVTSQTSIARTPKKVRVSPRGEQFIKDSETLSLRSYRIKGESSNTIGWGHKIKSSDPLWLRRKWVGTTISKSDAEKIFRADMDNFINPALNRVMKELENEGVNTHLLKQGFIDGLASLIYNCGESGVKRTKFYKHLLRNRISKAIDSVETTRVIKRGHATRRKAESKLMKN